MHRQITVPKADVLVHCGDMLATGRLSELVEVKGLRFYGTPWQPWYMDFAFNLAHDFQLADRWSLIPDSLDVLITHTPPHGIFDLILQGKNVGCKELRKRLEKVEFKYHLFGYIHEAGGGRNIAAVRLFTLAPAA